MILFGFEKWGFWVWLNVLWLNICLRWACVCVVVIALVWIFGFQMNGDFWVSNKRWLDGCLHLQTCACGSRRVRRKRLLLLLSLCVLCFQWAECFLLLFIMLWLPYVLLYFLAGCFCVIICRSSWCLRFCSSLLHYVCFGNLLYNGLEYNCFKLW